MVPFLHNLLLCLSHDCLQRFVTESTLDRCSSKFSNIKKPDLRDESNLKQAVDRGSDSMPREAFLKIHIRRNLHDLKPSLQCLKDKGHCVSKCCLLLDCASNILMLHPSCVCTNVFPSLCLCAATSQILFSRLVSKTPEYWGKSNSECPACFRTSKA